MTDTDQLILKHFRKPDGYQMSDEQWREHVEYALGFGCDWLEHLNSRLNPMPAMAVDQLVKELDALKAEVVRLRGQVADAAADALVREHYKAENERLREELRQCHAFLHDVAVSIEAKAEAAKEANRDPHTTE